MINCFWSLLDKFLWFLDDKFPGLFDKFLWSLGDKFSKVCLISFSGLWMINFSVRCLINSLFFVTSMKYLAVNNLFI